MGGGAPGSGGGTGTGTGSGSGPALPPSDLLVGVGSRVITPTRYELFIDANGDGQYQDGEPWEDAGVDRLFDPYEPGAMGPDGRPGVAGVDDDGDGVVDEIDEYRAAGSDDVRDAAGDNFSLTTNQGGTEGDRRFQMVPLAGYGGFYGIIVGKPAYRPMIGVMDDIYSRTIAISRGGTDLILQSNDLAGMLHIDINPVKRRIERELGIPFANVIIASTHVHSSPDCVGIWAGTDFDQRWVEEVREQMFFSARDAYLSRLPAHVKSATIEPESGYDRTTRVRKTAPNVRTADCAADQNDPARGYDAFLLQHDIRDPIVRNTAIVAVRFDDAVTANPIATLVNWHDHPEILGSDNLFLSSDWPGFTRARIEREWGGTCVYFSGTVGGQIGCSGGVEAPLRDTAGNPVFQPGVFDANGQPVPAYVRQNGLDKIRSIGLAVGEYAIAALRHQPYTFDPPVAIRTSDLDVDFENPAFQALASLLQRFRTNVDRADDPIRASHFVSAVGAARIQVSYARIGDCEILTYPGEAPPEYFLGRRASVARYPGSGYPDYPFPAMPSVSAYLTARDKMAFSLANSYLGYLVPNTDYLNLWDMNHPNYYEEQVSAGYNFGDNVGNKLLEMVGAPVRFSRYPIRP